MKVNVPSVSVDSSVCQVNGELVNTANSVSDAGETRHCWLFIPDIYRTH